MVNDTIGQEPFELMTSNICSGGAFFKTEKQLSAGTEVKINMTLYLDKIKKFMRKRTRKRSYIDVSGTVIRTEKNGMAICFDENYNISPYEM